MPFYSPRDYGEPVLLGFRMQGSEVQGSAIRGLSACCWISVCVRVTGVSEVSGRSLGFALEPAGFSAGELGG